MQQHNDTTAPLAIDGTTGDTPETVLATPVVAQPDAPLDTAPIVAPGTPRKARSKGKPATPAPTTPNATSNATTPAKGKPVAPTHPALQAALDATLAHHVAIAERVALARAVARAALQARIDARRVAIDSARMVYAAMRTLPAPARAAAVRATYHSLAPALASTTQQGKPIVQRAALAPTTAPTTGHTAIAPTHAAVTPYVSQGNAHAPYSVVLAQLVAMGADTTPVTLADYLHTVAQCGHSKGTLVTAVYHMRQAKRGPTLVTSAKTGDNGGGHRGEYLQVTPAGMAYLASNPVE